MSGNQKPKFPPPPPPPSSRVVAPPVAGVGGAASIVTSGSTTGGGIGSAPASTSIPSYSSPSSNSPIRSRQFPLPPPPPPPPSLSARPLGSTSSTTTTISPPPSSGGVPGEDTRPWVLPPHESTAPIDVLKSAPPSGNLDWNQPPPPILPTTTSSSSSMSYYQHSYPTPPPAIPLSYTSSSFEHQSALSSYNSSASTIVPTVVPLPPPPQVVSGTSSAFTAPPATRVVVPPPPVVLTTPATVSPTPMVTTTATTIATPSTPPPVEVATQPPSKLPPSTFLNKSVLPLLAKRQTHLPILVLATESAHQLAHKNSLQLVDLLEGLIQPQTSTSSGSSTTSMLPNQQPFRSVSKQLHLNEILVRFLEPEQLYVPMNDTLSQQVLNQHAMLREEDGNLQHELTVLEDQVDNLLNNTSYDGGPSSSSGGGSSSQRHTSSSLSSSTTTDASSSTLPDHHHSYVHDTHQERISHWEQVVKDAYALTSPLHIPWLWRYRVACDYVTDAMPWDLCSVPTLVLCVCTTSEQVGIVETLQSLVQSPYSLPKPYHTGLLDPNSVRKEVLVLHDSVDGPPNDAWSEVSLKQQLLQSFGSNSSIVRCNSISMDTAQLLKQEETTDLWGGGGTLGNCLSVSDRVRLRKYLTSLLSLSVLPAMERRIADLNAIVSEKKKGVKNVLKSLWGGGRTSGGSTSTGNSSHGGSDSTNLPKIEMASPDEYGPVLYRHDSIESQTRLLADSLFLMKDYDAALSMYRLIKDDFKQDKAHAHYGSVQEMMALCMYLIDPYGRSKDIFSYCENALLSYSRAAEDERPPSWGEKPGRPTSAPRSTRLATRLCLVLISTKNICIDRHLEVADLLASASSHETSLGAAVLLEQSSSHYFMAEMYRKYAFHMLMSGHMFRSAEQEHHAFRCFTSSLHIYRDSKWEELHNHLRSALAAQLYSMNRMAVALQLYAKLVGSTEGGRVSAKSQQKFVKHLLEICNEHPKKALIGADRMIVSAKLSGELRDAVRKERLDRIVQVVRYTKSASRVLELPNIDLPGVDDSTVAVLADQSCHHESWIPSFGDVQRGSEAVWDELQISATADLDLIEGKVKSKLDGPQLATLLRLEDVEIRRVIAQIDREKTNRVVAERAKKRESKAADFPVRAQMEPLAVEFAISNPLGIPIDLVDLQIVARMTEKDSNKVCTNEDAIKITPLVSYDQKKTWNFLGSSVSFEIADFCRVSSGGPDPVKQPWKAAEEVEPFFVVTKTSMTLEAESRRTISVSICPLTRGTLEIVGLRCRLLDDVWVFHPFDVKGPLLQNTRSNRANRVRGESMLLKASVERGMPCLKSELVRPSLTSTEEHGPVLQGQVGSWILRLSNVGTATAQNVFLKTNLPWIDVKLREGQAMTEYEGTCCIGCTGTLFKLPVTGPNLKITGHIEPGESVDVPIRIRATGAGRQDFYMLFRYELLDDSSAKDSSSQPRYRWLHKMVEVPVYPSLSLSAATMPSFGSSSDHILSLEVTNNRTDRPDKLDLLLDKLLLVSRRYRLEPLAGQFAGLTKAKLGWQERATVHYRLVALEEESDSILLTESSFSPSDSSSIKLDSEKASLLHYPCFERAHEAFEKSLKDYQKDLSRASAAQGSDQEHPRSIAQIRRANTSTLTGTSNDGSDDHAATPATSIDRLCPTERSDEFLCVALCWSDEISKVSGEHYLRDVVVRPSSKSNGCPISITAQHPASLSTNFRAGPARVPVNVTLRNRLVRDLVEFKFSVEGGERFDFVGPECFKSALGAGEEMAVPLQALIPAPGVYDLQKVRLTIDNEDAPPFVFPMQWLVTVNEL